jgi:hypothetical protein
MHHHNKAGRNTIYVLVAYALTFYLPGLAETKQTVYPGPLTVSLLLFFMLVLSGPTLVMVGILEIEKQLTIAGLLIVACLAHVAVGYASLPSTQLRLLEQAMSESQKDEEEHFLEVLKSESSPVAEKVDAATRLYQNNLWLSLVRETRGATVPFTGMWYWPVVSFSWAGVFGFIAYRSFGKSTIQPLD